MDNIIAELQWRKIISNISNEEKVLAAQNQNKGIYCGFDPTNDSLHLGNLMQIVLLRRFALFGFQPIAVIGGATAMIGDPSGKSQERKLLSVNQLQQNIQAITKQLSKLISQQATVNQTNVLKLIINGKFLTAAELTKLKAILFESTNLNPKYQTILAEILQKLPLPLAELNLNHKQLLDLFQVLRLSKTVIEQRVKLKTLDFAALLVYLEQWNLCWANFVTVINGNNLTQTQRTIKVLNNSDWLSSFNFLEFLREVGKYFNLNQMIRKETVAARLESGISYTEFSYMTLQAYDFYHLFQNEDCYLQSGGSDQWGNITAGLELIRKLADEHSPAAGITINLLTKHNGEKFGKSENGAVFLDEQKTSTYQFYQFLVNQTDQDVIKLLTTLTFLNQTQIDYLNNLHNEHPSLRIGQQILAAFITTFVHQIAGYHQAVKITQALFHGKMHDLAGAELVALFNDAPHFQINSNETLMNVLLTAKICHSKRQAREFLQQQAITVNGEKIRDEQFLVTKQDAIDQKITLIKKGKKNYFLIFHQY